MFSSHLGDPQPTGFMEAILEVGILRLRVALPRLQIRDVELVHNFILLISNVKFTNFLYKLGRLPILSRSAKFVDRFSLFILILNLLNFELKFIHLS